MKRCIFALALASSVFMTACKPSTSSDSYNSGGKAASADSCSEPENPYDEGSGHYAGFEWAQNNDPGSCDGNSQSFIEGCEEYQRQQSEYEDCEANK